jgi:hypothetical protein
MLDLIHSHDTPRVYEKKYVRGADGKFVETVVDVTPAHEPNKRLMLVGLRERMQEATRNIAATEIQRVQRGINGRGKFILSVKRACNRVYGKHCVYYKKSKIENVVDCVIYTRL